MVEIKTPAEIDAIRASGRVVAEVLAAARAYAAPGVTLADLDSAARDVLAKAGATSPFLHYQPDYAPVPYPAVICTSVNDVALHGIPGRYRLQPGDLLSVDAGATLDGWVADAARGADRIDLRRCLDLDHRDSLAGPRDITARGPSGGPPRRPRRPAGRRWRLPQLSPSCFSQVAAVVE